MDKVILLDGGMGTMLQAASLKPGEMPELYAFEHPEVIANVHRLYIEAGANIKDVQKRLGHTSLSTTMDIYSHVTDKMKNETVEIFEQIIK